MLLSMNEQISREASWAFASDKLGRWLLHLPSGVVGKVSEVHAPGEFLSSRSIEAGGHLGEDCHLMRGCDLGERYVSVAVLSFEDGNAFLADPGNFLILGEIEIEVLQTMTKGLRDLCVGVSTSVMPYASTMGATPESIVAVLRAALQAQLRALSPR